MESKPKEYVIPQLEFELAYYEIAGQNVSYDTRKTLLHHVYKLIKRSK